MALYTDTVMDHFMHPRNVGEIPDADGVGQVGNAKCGDIMKMYLKIRDNVIQDVKFETFGCGSAIASSSMATEMIKGKTIDEALAVTNRQVVDALGGLPAHKLHCSVLAEEAVQAAVEAVNYYGGTVAGLSAIFATTHECMGYEVTSIFDPASLPDYASFDSRDCPLCKAGQHIDALVNSFGYSAL